MAIRAYDEAKVKRVIEALIAYPDGLWLRKLAQEAKVPTTTLHRYLEGFLAPFVENVGVRNDAGHFFGVRVVRLRPGALKRLQDGVPLAQLLKTSEIVDGVDS